MTEYERPNTVSGLVAKHKELRKLREQYRKEVKKLTISISHVWRLPCNMIGTS